MDEPRLKEGTAIRRIREETLALLQGPRIQITFLYGVFGSEKSAHLTSEEVEEHTLVLKQQIGRIRLVITETGGRFEDLGMGRFCATLGAVESTEEDPLMAVTLGLKLLRLATMSRQAPPLRIVVATGRVPQKSLESTLLQDRNDPDSLEAHDVLRLAQKIVEECPPGELYTNGMTARMVRDTHRCNRVKDLKGTLSTTNVPVYSVSTGSGVSPSTHKTHVYGRDKELQRIRSVFQRIELGEGPVFFTVTGELGIGKTQLIRTFSESVESRAIILKNPRERRRIDRWRRTPYSYFGELIRFYFEIAENEDPATRRNKLVTGLYNTLSPNKKGDLPLKMAHHLGLLCQIDFPDSPFMRDSSPAQLEQHASTALTQFIEKASEVRPMVFLLDDLYSADQSSLRLIKYLIQHLEPSRVLFLCASRLQLLFALEKEEELELPGERLVLKPLSRDSARFLLNDTLTDEVRLPESLRKKILDTAEGNPFFLREILRDLNEQSSTQDVQGSMIQDFDIPGNIEGILLSRLSRLSPQERDILQKAAIFGRGFWRSGVEMLYRQEADIAPGWRLQDGDILDREDDLEYTLETLTDQGMIQYQSESDFEGETQYHFSPSWLQDLVYKEIPKELLAPYHKLVAMWLEMQTHQHQGSNLDAEIAHHFDVGNEPTRSAPYHIEVGTQAKKVYATQRAITHLEKGLAHLGESQLPKRMFALRELAEVYILDGAYNKAMERFEEVLQLSWQMGNRVLAGATYIRMGRVHYLMRDLGSALNYMKNGHVLHQESGHPRGIATALSNMGEVYLLVGDYQQARLYLQEALDLRRELNHPSDLAYALSNMGNLLIEQGELEAARTYHEEALGLRQELGNPHLIIRSKNNLALIHMIQGEYDSALAEFLVSSNMAQKIGEKLMMAVITSNISELYLLRGDLGQAQKYLQTSMQIAERIGDMLIQAECHRIQGEIQVEEGNGLAALESCGKAYQLVTERGILSAQAPIYRLMAEIYAALPEETLKQQRQLDENPYGWPKRLLGAPIECYEESIKIAHQHGNLREEARTRMLMGMFEVNQGNIPRGRYQLQLAQETFQRLHMVSDLEEVSEMLNEVDTFQKEKHSTQQVTPSTTLPQPPLPIPTSLRPHRTKMANVEKTMAFRVSFDESEIGPAPTPAEIEDWSLQRATPPPQSSNKIQDTLPQPKASKKDAPQPELLQPLTHATPSTPPMVDATVKHTSPLAALMKQGVLKHANNRETPHVEDTSSIPSTTVPSASSTPTSSEHTLSPAPSTFELNEDDLVLETVHVEDRTSTLESQETTSASNPPPQRHTSAPPPPPPSSKRTKSSPPPPPRVQKRKPIPHASSPDTGAPSNHEAPSIPDKLKPLSELDVMPFLFATQPTKKPSVYDSQVIIAQVAEDDDISRTWFEEGRSDRADQFWEKHSEQRKVVTEDLIHEKVIDEIDKLDKHEKEKK